MSARHVRVTSLAESDFASALDWYRAANPAAAQRFLESFEKAYSLMESMPFAWQRIHHELDIRRISLKGFPYLLIYKLTESEIVLLAVHHASRSERNWTGRVNEDPVPYGKEAITMEPTAPNLKEALYQAGLCLPEEERIALGEKLIRSVEPDDLSPEWKAELDRRSDAVKEGTMACITLEELKLKYGRA